MSVLTFDPDTHTYRYGGQLVPGVTSVLAPITDYSAVPRAVLQRAADFGRAVHLACELDDLGELDEDSLDDALAPYLHAWRAFCADYEVQWDGIEVPGYSKTMRYAGTPDRSGVVQRLHAVVDIKTTATLMPSVGPQLAAYAALVAPASPNALTRIGVQLKGDGTYHAETYNNPSDMPLFLSLLTLRNWCSHHAVTPNFHANF